MRNRASSRRGPKFDDIKNAVWQEIVHATINYELLTGVMFPIYNEDRLRRAYPLIVPRLRHVFTGAVLMGLCRLFEQDGHASLSRFLARVQELEPVEKANEDRRRFLQTIPQLQGDIAKRWPSLALHRNGYLAHLDLTKTQRIEQAKLTYRDMRLALELAQRIYGAYRSVADDADLSLMFQPSELRSEPGQFLRTHFELEADT